MKKYEKIISIIMLTVISLSNVATPVAYAAPLAKMHLTFQLGVPMDPKVLTKPPQFFVPDQGSVLGASTTLFTIGTQKLDLQTGNAGSAFIRVPLSVEKLEKKVYETTEDVALTVVNPDNDTFTTSVTDASGKAVPVPVTESNTGTTTTVDLAPSNAIKPGLYKVTITDSANRSTEQDFAWGVLALNTDKSIYHPGENADIAMAVLNDNGDMVCDAQVSLEIMTPDGQIQTLTTKNGTIIINPQCQKHDYSLEPDYEAHYKFVGAGAYSLQLSATTANGTHSITDSIQVKDQIPFDVQRISATRIYPPNTYPMLFNVTANRDFSGTVTETVPDSFTVTPATQSAAQSYTAMQTVYLNSTDPTALMSQQIASTSGGLVMPFHGSYPITQGFGAQLTDPTLQAFYTQYGLAGHDGIDFGVPMGTPLYAVDDGNVIWSGPGDYGTMVTILHGWGQTYYGHMSNTSVTVGQHVEKGQLIGYSGMSGEATGPHLHFGMKPKNPDMTNGYYGKIDPMPFLPIGQGESISMLGQQANPVANLVYNTTVLGASDSAATPTPSDAPSLTPTPSPTVAPTVEPTSTPSPTPGSTDSSAASGAAETVSTTPTPTPLPSVFANPAVPANTSFTVLDKQIKLSEEIANDAQTQSVKILTWKVNLKKGESTTLGYAYQTPKVSPQFYLLGPAKFYEGNNEKLVFQEQRSWQIASDDVGVEWYQNAAGLHNWNGYSWQYRKKITINHTEASGSPSEPTATFMDSADASENLGFYTGESADSPTVDCSNPGTNSETGPCSYEFNAGSSGGNGSESAFSLNNVLADSGRRISMWVNFASLPASGGAGYDSFLAIFTVNEGTYITEINVLHSGIMCINTTSGAECGSTALTAGTWYHITFSYTITNTTTHSAKLYLNDSLYASVSTATNVDGWGTATGSNNLTFGSTGSGAAENGLIVRIDDVYIDSGTDLSDPGAIHVTAKRPNSNGTTNSFGTQINISDAGSGYGSGHSPQVNERPVNTNSGWSTTSSGATEEYTIENALTGDVNLSSDTLVSDDAWAYAGLNTSSCATGSLINNGVASTITLNTTKTYYHSFASLSFYPSGGTDVGIKSCSTNTTSLYEAGVQIAYLATSPSLTNFPVLINIPSDTNLSNHAQSSGNDILFTDSTGRNLLPFEIESYNSGTLTAWVNISSLSSATDTIIYMYYGNPSASSQANAHNVWDSNYVGVWHLGPTTPNGSTLSINDSTSNVNNGTNSSPAVTYTSSGNIDGAGAFVYNGSTPTHITVASSTSLNTLTSAMTISAWVKPTATDLGSLFNRIISRNVLPNTDWVMEMDGSDAGHVTCGNNDNNNEFDFAQALTAGQWYLLTCTLNSSAENAYLNGAFSASGTGEGSIATTGNVGIGADTDGTTGWDGTIDEVQVSNIVRSAGWITTEYNNQSAPGSFITVGSPEETDIYAPTMSQVMRHGEWFDSTGKVQPFVF